MQFLTHDGDRRGNVSTSSAPSNTHWNTVLAFGWRRGRWGDWLDADARPFGMTTTGARAYATFAVPAPGDFEMDVTPLVRRWISSGENRGFYLRMRGNNFAVRFAGRTHADTAKRPRLIVTTSSGVRTFDARCNACWAISALGVISSSEAFALSGQQPAIVQFDLAGLSGTIISARLGVSSFQNDTGSTATQGVVEVYEADPPTFVVPDDVPSPQLGIAAAAGSYAALSSHPDVIFNGDMSLPGWSERGFANPVERAFDADAGAVVARTSFVTTSRAAADFRMDSSRGTGPQGEPDVVYDELYGRYWMRLSENFGSTTESIKIPAMGLQWGWWNINGYWQQTTGNGGSPPSGFKVWNSAQGKWEYQGSSVRILTSLRATDNSAYSNLMSLSLYPYNLDQTGPFPPGEGFPYIALRRGRAYWFDFRVKQNSVAGSPDINGNYPSANADGVYQVWINGYPAFNKTTFRWRRHLEHGVQGIWVDWFHGGTQNPPYPMEFSSGPVTLAKRYIGPPR